MEFKVEHHYQETTYNVFEINVNDFRVYLVARTEIEVDPMEGTPIIDFFEIDLGNNFHKMKEGRKFEALKKVVYDYLMEDQTRYLDKYLDSLDVSDAHYDYLKDENF